MFEESLCGDQAENASPACDDGISVHLESGSCPLLGRCEGNRIKRPSKWIGTL
jgi:hypothetical protein